MLLLELLFVGVFVPPPDEGAGAGVGAGAGAGFGQAAVAAVTVEVTAPFWPPAFGSRYAEYEVPQTPLTVRLVPETVEAT